MGISVDNNKGGWDSLLAFARARDKENREAACGAISRRKWSRNYRALQAQSTMKRITTCIPSEGPPRGQRVLSLVTHEDCVLECVGLGQLF